MVFETIVLENSNIQLIDGDRGKNYPKHTDFNQMGHCLFLSAKNVTVNGFEFSDTTYISKEKDEQLRAGKLVRGDIVLTTRGTIGNVGLYDDQIKQEHIRVNSGMMIFRPDPKVWNSRFLYFVLTSDFVKNQIYSLTTGSAVPQLPAKDLKKFLLPKVEKEYQDKIVAHISCVVDKITLNRQINQTLEQMAQTLFKSWFVDFNPVIDNALDAGNDIPDTLQERAEQRRLLRAKADFKPLPAETRALFPSEFEETELGWVPKGWEVGCIADFGSIVCGKTPSKDKNEFYGGAIPFIKIPDMHKQVFIVETSDSLSLDGSNSQIKKLIPKDSICVSCIATVGLVAIASKASHTNQQINSIVPFKPYFRDYLYFSMKDKYDLFHDLASGGSTTLNMNTSTFSKVQMLKPANEILLSYQKLSSSFLSKNLANEFESQSLIKIRDISDIPQLI